MILFSDPVFLVEVVMLSAVLATGLYISYTDIKYRLVPNRWTFSLLVVGVIGQLIMIHFEIAVLSNVIAVFLIALMIALGLIFFGFWAPGDAKLFIAVAVALPPTLCPFSDPFSLQISPCALVVNSLTCYLIVLLFVPLWRQVDKSKRNIDQSNRRQGLQGAWDLAGLLGLTLGFALIVMERPLSYLEAFAALIIGYRLLERGLEAKYWPVLLLPGLSILLFVCFSTKGLKEYILLWGTTWIVELMYLRIRYWYNRAFVQVFPVQFLRPGAILYHPLRVEDNEGEIFIYQASKPLSEQEVRNLHELSREGCLPDEDMVELEQAIPFVPFLVGGAVLTAFFAGNLVPPLVKVVVWLSG